MPPLAHDGLNSIVAALGPTNTGKTHHAVARMLEHPTGMIGLPLRLLAREVYDRVTAQVGERSVALITGEERRVPPRPKYFVCTTEAMPVDRDVDFVAVDEVQLAEHPQRGHVFTGRMLHARGVRETWLMGAETMRDRIRELVPTATVEVRPRLSRLASAGRISIKALPARSAVVAFSTAQVYELADRIQRIHGGAAVVLGALSPRTRNAQVAMYQAGEVRHMVATDAIGMGLNMNVDLVAFAGLRKFDGQRERMLETSELAQIAGRAGRYMNDGAFATLAPLPALSPETVFALENHAFPQVRRLFWRNQDLDTSSIDGLIASLRQRPRHASLRQVDQAEDHEALMELAGRPEVRRLASSPERVRLLWDVCQIPDFRQLLLESHLRFLSDLYQQLAGHRAVVDVDWMARQVARLDDVQGDIETLMMRISFVRTWTYVANHGRWVQDAAHWQQRTREIEDRLSDALHDRLVQRFVTQGRSRGGAPTGSRARRHPLASERDAPLPDSPFRVLAGWKLHAGTGPVPHPGTTPDAWVDAILDAEHEAFDVDSQGQILHAGHCVGRLSAGSELLRPEARVVVDESVGAGAKLQLQRRLSAFARDWVGGVLAPLQSSDLAALSPAGRGLVHQLSGRLGTVAMVQAREQVADLTGADRRTLKQAGIVVGSRFVFARALLVPSVVRQRVLLCRVFLSLRPVGSFPDGTGTWCPLDGSVEPTAYTAMGYPLMGDRGVRVDVVDRVVGALTRLSGTGAFELPERVVEWLGVEPGVDARAVMAAFGYEPGEGETWQFGGASSRARPRRRR